METPPEKPAVVQRDNSVEGKLRNTYNRTDATVAVNGEYWRDV